MLSQLFKNLNFKQIACQQARFSENLGLFTDFAHKQRAEELKKKVTTGRSWKADELRLKSSQDLHKLWYVLLMEKNALMSDNIFKKKIYGKIGQQGRISKIRVSMARLLTVINERQRVCQEYRAYLENQYIEEQKLNYQAQLLEQQQKNQNEPVLPDITYNLLKAKYNDLKRGVDNTNYIQETLDIQKKREQLKQYLNEKYDYQKKQIVKEDSVLQNKDESQVIRQFQSQIQYQLATGKLKISEDEVLRAHIKNWKMLNLKQRRVVLGFLNARRAKDAKSEFLKELSLLGQKIAYDNLQQNKK